MLPLAKDRPHPTQVFAVMRLSPDRGALENQVTVKEIVSTVDLAEAEAARLNALNGGKRCRSVWQATRLFTPGTSAGRDAPDSSSPAI